LIAFSNNVHGIFPFVVVDRVNTDQVREIAIRVTAASVEATNSWHETFCCPGLWKCGIPKPNRNLLQVHTSFGRTFCVFSKLVPTSHTDGSVPF